VRTNEEEEDLVYPDEGEYDMDIIHNAQTFGKSQYAFLFIRVFFVADVSGPQVKKKVMKKKKKVTIQRNKKTIAK
jgi:hypothetical protein